MLTGALEPDGGSVKLGANLAMATLDQHRDSLDPNTTVAGALTGGSGETVMVGGEPRHVIGYMKDFLFTPEQAGTAVSALSGGERGRLTLARALAKPSNLLVLDEPTNDLDLETLDLLQEVIADYEGTVLIVSHDRDFLDRTVTVTLGLDGTGLVDAVVGGYADWEAKRRPRLEARKAPPKAVAAPEAPKRATKLSYKDQRDYDLLPKRIEEIDREVARHETALADPQLYARDPGKFDRLSKAIEALRDEKDAAELRWLELAEQVEALG